MKLTRYVLFFYTGLCLLGNAGSVVAQCNCTINMSFERNPAQSCDGETIKACYPGCGHCLPDNMDESWTHCPYSPGSLSTTDIHTGSGTYGFNEPPTDGNTYMGFWGSGGSTTAEANGERVGFSLCSGAPLQAGTQYCFTLDYVRPAGGFNAGVILLIEGGMSMCNSGEILWQSPASDIQPAGTWGKWTFCFTPTQNWTHIRFRSIDAPSAGFGGYLGIDNWVSTDSKFPPKPTNCGPTIVVTGTSVCPSACATLTATPAAGTVPYTYSWSPGSGSTASSYNVCPSSSTTYTVTVTDNSGNTSTDTAVVTINSPPAPTISKTDVACSGGSNGSATTTVSSGTSPFTYSWSPAGGNSSTATGLSAGTYTVTTTDNKGCSGTSSVVITQPVPLSLAPSTTQANCGSSDGAATVISSGGTSPFTYLWATTPPQTTPAATGLSQGTYTVTVTDNKGCSAITSATVTSSGAATASTNGSDVSCGGGTDGSATAGGTGGTAPYTYSWSTVPVQNSMNATGLSSGTYTVTLTDNLGCISTATVLIGQPALISLSASKSDANCGNSDGTATVTINSGGTSPFTYQWSGIVSNSSQVSGLSAGTFTVTVTDQNGCSTTSTISVNDIGSPSVTVTQVNILCNGSSTGSISGTVSGGVFPYTYQWSGGATTSAITGLSAGSYTLTVRGINGCSVTTVVTIIEPSAVSLNTSKTDANCGASDGSVTVNSSGGVSPFTYVWSGGGITAVITGVSSGSYTVTVTDANACSKTAIENVNDIGAPSVTASKTDLVCNGTNTGSATATASAGISPYTYSWSNGGTGSVISNLSAGTYAVTVTSANGCKATTNLVVTEPTAMTVSITKADEACGQGNGSATATVAGGSGSYTYSWNSVSGSIPITIGTVSGLNAGSYTVTVTDGNNCTRSVVTAVINNNNIGPSADFIMDPPITEILAPTINFFDKSGGASSWFWTFGDGDSSTDVNPKHNYREAGTYTVCLNIVNSLGCPSSFCSDVIINPIWTFYVPNAFSPDGDGKNDFFSGYGTGIKKYELYIFDRWGDLLFASTDPGKPWDGKANGGPLTVQEDVYVYLINITDVFDKKHSYAGGVTVVR